MSAFLLGVVMGTALGAAAMAFFCGVKHYNQEADQ
jgi:hypothetical protein